MKKTILFTSVMAMLFCVACGSKDAVNVQDEPATSEIDNTENNSTNEDETFSDTTYDYLADGFSTLARYVETESDSMLFVFETEGPIVVRYRNAEEKDKIENIIKDLTSGDLVAIKCGLIAESYPGQSELYDIKKLEDGELNDISDDTLSSLKEMGWIE